MHSRKTCLVFKHKSISDQLPHFGNAKNVTSVFFCYFITLQYTIQTVEMLPSDAEHIVELTPASTSEHIEAVAMMPTESEPVEPIDAQIVETVE